MGLIRGFFFASFLGAAASGYGAYWLIGTKVEAANVQSRITYGCHVLQAGAYFSSSPELQQSPIASIDCGCVAERMVEKHGEVFVADMLEVVRQDAAAKFLSAWNMSGPAEKMPLEKIVRLDAKIQRLANTMLSVNRFCPA